MSEGEVVLSAEQAAVIYKALLTACGWVPGGPVQGEDPYAVVLAAAEMLEALMGPVREADA